MVLGTLGYSAVAALAGSLLGNLGGFEGPFFYTAYVLPTFVMMLPCTLAERVVITLAMVVAFLSSFFLPHPEHLNYPLAHIPFSSLIMITSVDIYFGHRITKLLEERLAMEHALGTQGEALARDNRELEERVRHQTGSVRSLLDRLETDRVETRTAVARDLHDGMGQLVVGTRLELHQIERALDTGEELSTENLGYLYGLVDRLDRQVREMVRDLRQPGVVAGLRPALTALVESYERVPGPRVTLEMAPMEEPPGAVSEVVVAVAREALTNVAKHAQATQVSVRVSATADKLALRVEDDGKGFGGPGERARGRRSAPESYGLVGMRERVHAAGGSFQLRSLENCVEGQDCTCKGVRVLATLPLARAPHTEASA
jgi:signal transduction histidine kinase